MTEIDDIRNRFAALREQRRLTVDSTLEFFDREEAALWKRLQDAHDRAYWQNQGDPAVTRRLSPPILPALVLRATSGPIVAYRAAQGLAARLRAWAAHPSRPRVSRGRLGQPPGRRSHAED